MEASLIGLRLSDSEYEIREQLAKGGMATVYKAYSRSLDSIVAVKVLAPQLAADPAFRERFHAEATSIEQGLHHPNIIEVKRHGEEQGICYIVMRYVPGGTLKELLAELGGMMDLTSAARLTAQVASALQHAHEAGCIHLDVKPANILLGSADWPLLSDFGIVRILGETNQDENVVAGTPPYMSPEQWRGHSIDGSSDEYSLAVMFYQMVTGQLPFSGDPAKLKEQHLNVEPPRPRELNPGIPGPVEEVILRGLEKDPDDRFPTIGEFGEALVEAVERSRGMQLETKQAMVSAAPSLVALVALFGLFGPMLNGLADPDMMVFGRLTLNWPIALLTALLEAALLMGIRWHLIGLATRLFGAVLDAVDRFTRMGVRIGTDAQGPLRIKAWRNSAVGSAEGLVNVAYLFILYQIMGEPIVKLVAELLNPYQEMLIATGIAALVLVIAAAIILKLYRDSGPIVAVVALTLCWGLISAIPIVDVELGHGVSLQWLAKLAIGLAVLLVLLAVRGRVQREVREFVVPLFDRQAGQLLRGWTIEQVEAQRQAMGRTSDGLVNVVFLIVGYPIIVPALRQVLETYMYYQQGLIAAAITVVVIVAVAIMVNRLRVSGGVVPAALGLLISAPLLIGLPLFEDSLQGNDFLMRSTGVAIALAMLAIFLTIRKPVQAMARATLVPGLDGQLGALIHARSEEDATARRAALDRASDTLVNVLYMLAGYLIVIRPLAGVLDAADFGWVGIAVNVLYLVVVLLIIVRFVRGLMSTLRQAPAPAHAVASVRPV